MSSFQLSLTVLSLLSVLELYLGLEVDDSRIQAQYPMYPTLESAKIFSISLTGLSPSEVSLSREIQIHRLRFKAVHTPHLYYISVKHSVCPKLLSLADTNNISIDFFS